MESRSFYPTLGDNWDVGFRVAAIPEPAGHTLAMFGAVGLVAFIWRRRHLSVDPVARNDQHNRQIPRGC